MKNKAFSTISLVCYPLFALLAVCYGLYAFFGWEISGSTIANDEYVLYLMYVFKPIAIGGLAMALSLFFRHHALGMLRTWSAIISIVLGLIMVGGGIAIVCISAPDAYPIKALYESIFVFPLPLILIVDGIFFLVRLKRAGDSKAA